MLGYKKSISSRLGESVGNKQNFTRYLGEKLVIDNPVKKSMASVNRTDEIHNVENLLESDPKVKHERPKDNVLRTKKSEKPNDGFNAFI
jgi:hypothetical protein